jgi:hypothetical protein
MTDQTAKPGPVVGPVDEPPRGGVFQDWDGAQHDPDLIAEGNRLGEQIDPDDDNDNGLWR